MENTGILPMTSVTATTAVTGERQLNDTLDQSLQTTEDEITPSKTQVDVTAIPTLAPEGTGDTPTQTVSQTGSSVGNQVPCVCPGSHGLANCGPNTTEKPKKSAAAKKRKETSG